MGPGLWADLSTVDPHTFVIGGAGRGRTILFNPYALEKEEARRRIPELLERPEHYHWPNRMLGKLIACIFARG